MQQRSREHSSSGLCHGSGTTGSNPLGLNRSLLKIGTRVQSEVFSTTSRCALFRGARPLFEMSPLFQESRMPSSDPARSLVKTGKSSDREMTHPRKLRTSQPQLLNSSPRSSPCAFWRDRNTARKFTLQRHPCAHFARESVPSHPSPRLRIKPSDWGAT